VSNHPAGLIRCLNRQCLSPAIHPMLIATWILAVATAVLALSGPVALFAWLSARRQDRDRRQREREDEARQHTLRDAAESASKQYATKDALALSALVLAVFTAWVKWGGK
jgi:hypothetical protein